jgi:hypothetical protein
LLLVSAELALLIWWGRSQSQKDFDGRYWLWIRITLAWLALSGCVAASAPAVCRATILHFRPEISGIGATLGWLMPASIAGTSIVLALHREMRGCRWSGVQLWIAAVLYLAAGILEVAGDELISLVSRMIVLQAALLAGHVSLLTSMWVHARHVLRCTSDPAVRPQSGWRIPRPHFRLPRLPRNRTGAVETVSANSLPQQNRLARGGLDLKPAAEAATHQHAGRTPTVERGDGAERPRFRVDSRHEAAAAESGEPAARERPDAPHIPESGRDVALPNAEDSSLVGHENDGLERTGEIPAQPPSKPDLRGLSKKQRRRLMQELRERERAAGQ